MLWPLIAEARRVSTDCCEVTARATTLAAALPPAEIVTVHQQLQRALHDSYQPRMLAAAHLMTGGCSDDGFDYFRCWLVTCGQEVFDAAMTNPDTLADQLRPSWLGYECENALYIASTAHQQATGRLLPAEAWLRKIPEMEWESDLDDKAALRRDLPRLAALFLN